MARQADRRKVILAACANTTKVTFMQTNQRKPTFREFWISAFGPTSAARVIEANGLTLATLNDFHTSTIEAQGGTVETWASLRMFYTLADALNAKIKAAATVTSQVSQ